MAGHKKQCHRSRTAERQGPERTQDAGLPEVVPKRAGEGHQSHIHSAFCPPKGRVCVCQCVLAQCFGPLCVRVNARNRKASQSNKKKKK